MKNIVVITQCFQCGSWGCIEKILDQLADDGYTPTIVGLGKIQQKSTKFEYIQIPYLEYNRYGNLANHPILNLLWNLPLIAIGLIAAIYKRPGIVIFNGLATGLTMSPIIKILGLKTVIMYHSFIGGIKNQFFKTFLISLGKSVDMVVVNSRGSGKDVSLIFDKSKIIINEHFADEVFFENIDHKLTSKFTVNYIGRIDEDKLCFPLMDAAKNLYLDGDFDFVFRFIGAGSAIDKIETLASECSTVEYKGYIKDRRVLKKYLEESDISWSLANETYLCIPAVEALAAGVPVIIPIYSEVKNPDGNRALVEKELLPEGVGWFVDPNNLSQIISLLKDIKANGIDTQMRNRCALYAKEKYSKANLDGVVLRIKSLFGKEETFQNS